jgi:hypothetical protein
MGAVSFASFHERQKHEPVFVILGGQGSGTNMLSRILVRGFKFATVHDGSVVFNMCAKLGNAPSINDVRRQYAALRPRLLPDALTRKTRRLVFSNANFDRIDDSFDPATIKSAADMTRFVYSYAAFSLGTDRTLVKSDDLWETINRMDDVIPNRRIILITRDFRDELLSIAGGDFGPVEPLVAARYVKERFRHYQREYDRTPPEHRLHVRYEDVLESALAFVQKVAAHFGIEMVPGGEESVTAVKIRPSRVKKWARLDPTLLGHLESILGDELRACGYETGSEHPTPPDGATWMIATTKDAFKRIPQKIERVLRRLRS